MPKAGPSSGARHRLMTELALLQKEKWVHFEKDVENVQKWRFAIMVVNTDSAFNGGYFRAEMQFPEDYPYAPPRFRFMTPIYHPNIYPDGALCISILHKPGEDLTSGEEASERWSPLQGVESVLRSVLLLLDDPEIQSPANVDAGVMYRDNRVAYNAKAKKTVESSKKEIPQGFVMPTSFEPAPPPKADNTDDDFWAESDEEDYDFGGSDTGEEGEDQEMGEDEEDAEEMDEDEDDEEDEEEDEVTATR